MFGGPQPRHRLPSYGGLEPSYESYSPYTKQARRSGGGAGGVAVWVVGLLLTAALGGLGWQLHSARATLVELQAHADIVEQSLISEKVRGRGGATRRRGPRASAHAEPAGGATAS